MKRIARVGLIVAVLGICLAVVAQFPLNHDAAWFMTVARRMLAGEVLYADIIEVNPPLIIYLTLPAAVLSDAVGLSDVLSLKLLVLGIAGGAALWHVRLLGSHLGSSWTAWWAAVLSFAVLVVPASDFAQREHFLVLLTLPFIAVKWLRVNRFQLALRQAYGAGVLAGLGFAIKPHFVLIWLAVEAFDWSNNRGGKGKYGLRPESLGVACVFVVYGILMAGVHPEYFTQMADIAALYSRFSSESGRLLMIAFFAIPMLLVFLAAACSRSSRRRHNLAMLFLVFGGASLGVALIQGKGWRYHSLPLIVATVLSWAVLAEASGRTLATQARRTERLRAAFVLIILVVAVHPFSQGLTRALSLSDDLRVQNLERAEHIARHAPESLLVLTDRVPDGFPLINHSGARPTSPYSALWWIRARYGSGTSSPPVANECRTALELRLSEVLVANFVKTPPDLVLVDTARHERYGRRAFPYVEYLSHDSAFADVWQRYERIDKMGRFSIWQIRPEERTLR